MKFPSRVLKSRHGIYYLRIQRFGLDRRISLRTRDPLTASLAGYRLGVRIAVMDIDKFKNLSEKDIYDLKLTVDGDRVEIVTDGSDTEQRHAMEAMKLLLESRSNRHSDTQIPTVSKQSSINAALSTLNKTTLRWALDTYYPIMEKSKDAIKTKKMAKTALERVCRLLQADFDMHNFNDEVIEIFWMQPRLLEVKANTVKKELSWIRSFSKWAAEPTRKYCSSPLTLTISADDNHWEYFRQEDLKAIFDTLPDVAEEAWQFWIPIIGLYTGGRIGEIAALQTKHFFKKTNLEIMHLPGTKNRCAPRDIPIHPDLINLGILDLVEFRKKAGKSMIFELKPSGQNGYGGTPSSWFSEFIREKAGISDDRKVFHSFRHTIVDHLRQHESQQEARMQYLGHSTGNSVHNYVYGREPLGLAALQERVVSKIDWGKYCGWSLDIPKLTNVAKQLCK